VFPEQHFAAQQRSFSPEAQSFVPFQQGAFDTAFDDAFPPARPEPAPFPPTQRPQPTTPQHFRESSAESTLDQQAPPHIAPALSPPLAARGFPGYAESATSSLAVNPPRSAVGSLNGDSSPRISEDISSKEFPGLVNTVEPVVKPPPQEGPVVSDVQETEIRGSDDEITPVPIHLDTSPEILSPQHGPRSADAITFPETVQETLSRPPRDEDLAITSPEPTDINLAEQHEPDEKLEVKGVHDEELKGVALPGGFPSNESDEGRESWVDLGDESKSFPSEQPHESSLPPNRSDPFAFATSSAPPKAATKEDFDAAFSGFGNMGKKEENGVFKKDFNSEFPPIEEFGDDDSDSEEEAPGNFGFNDDFTKGNEIPESNGHTTLAATGKSIETPLQQTLPIIASPDTAIKVPSPSTTPDTLAPLTDAPPPVPPKDTLSVPDESSAPPITPGRTPPPETGADPPAYSEYRNITEESAGSNDLSGLLPQRGEPHMSAAPYTSPPPNESVLATPAPFAPPEPVSFSPAPPAKQMSSVPSYFSPALSPFPVESPSQPAASPAPQISISQLAPPVIEEPKSITPSQTFGAFDFSGLQDAAPLDESQDDPFRLSTRSDAFGEFDTTFDSAPVTPAKQGTLPPAKDEFSNFDFGVPADFDSFPGQSATTQQSTTSESNFDDVFASFDRPTQLSPPELPARQPSPLDDPNLKTLTGMDSLVLFLIIEMGFARTDAIKALEKHNYNLSEVYLLMMMLTSGNKLFD
jgi:hypothetical protein